MLDERRREMSIKIAKKLRKQEKEKKEEDEDIMEFKPRSEPIAQFARPT